MKYVFDEVLSCNFETGNCFLESNKKVSDNFFLPPFASMCQPVLKKKQFCFFLAIFCSAFPSPSVIDGSKKNDLGTGAVFCSRLSSNGSPSSSESRAVLRHYYSSCAEHFLCFGWRRFGINAWLAWFCTICFRAIVIAVSYRVAMFDLRCRFRGTLDLFFTLSNPIL